MFNCLLVLPFPLFLGEEREGRKKGRKDPVCNFWKGVLGSEYLLSTRRMVDSPQWWVSSFRRREHRAKVQRTQGNLGKWLQGSGMGSSVEGRTWGEVIVTP